MTFKEMYDALFVTYRVYEQVKANQIIANMSNAEYENWYSYTVRRHYKEINP